MEDIQLVFHVNKLPAPWLQVIFRLFFHGRLSSSKYIVAMDMVFPMVPRFQLLSMAQKRFLEVTLNYCSE